MGQGRSVLSDIYTLHYPFSSSRAKAKDPVLSNSNAKVWYVVILKINMGALAACDKGSL